MREITFLLGFDEMMIEQCLSWWLCDKMNKEEKLIMCSYDANEARKRKGQSRVYGHFLGQAKLQEEENGKRWQRDEEEKRERSGRGRWATGKDGERWQREEEEERQREINRVFRLFYFVFGLFDF